MTVVVGAPGLGDDLQAIKAGILEVADILVVNKADLPGADETARQLEAMLGLRSAIRGDTPVLSTVATTGDGVAALVEAAMGLSAAVTPEERSARAERQAIDRLATMAGALMRDALNALPAEERRALVERVRARRGRSGRGGAPAVERPDRLTYPATAAAAERPARRPKTAPLVSPVPPG